MIYHMNLQGMAVVNPFATMGTMHWPQSSVRIKVFLQSVQSQKRFSALMTHMGSLVTVNFDVSSQQFFSAELLTTILTLDGHDRCSMHRMFVDIMVQQIDL
jgi:hypothetical protein